MNVHDPYVVLDLRPYFNNDGISSDANRADGDFTGNGKTYPAEDLPPSNAPVEFDGIVFHFPDKSDGLDNNILLEGQVIPIPKDIYDTLYVLGASIEKDDLEDTLYFVCADDSREEAFLGLSGWYACHCLKYGEQIAIKCSGYHVASQHVYMDRVEVDYGMWIQTIPIRSRYPLSAIELPDNPGMHIFAMTLRRFVHQTA